MPSPLRSPAAGNRRQRRARTALAAGLAAAALLLTACSSTADDGAGAAASTDPGPGVSAEEIRIGFITINQATAGGSGGFVVPDNGDPEAQIDALVAAVNAQGGIAGRTVVPVLKSFESSTASPQTEAALCTAFTDDDEVFAVVLAGQRSQATRTCYQKANTVMVDTTANVQAQNVYDELAPHYWTPGAPTLETHLRTLVASLDAQGFFEGDVKVGVIAEKGPQYGPAVDEVLIPELQALGLEDVERSDIDQSTPDAAATTSRQTVTDFKAADVDRVIFAGRADNTGYFTGTALPQKYFPRLAMSSFDGPNFAVLNPAFFPPQSLEGAVGTGIVPTKDGVEDLAFPDGAAESACMDVYTEAGITFPARPEAENALRSCDSLMMLKAGLDGLGDEAVNAQNLADSLFALGSDWQAAATFRTEFTDGVYAPASGYRDLVFSDGRFTYTSDVKPFVRD
jgi:hypothetical protein